MKREDLIALGLTDEQVEKVIAENSKDVQNANKNAEKAKKELDDLRESAGNVEELQKKLEEIEQSKMTDAEKFEDALKKANQKIADLEKDAAIRDSRAAAVEKFKVTTEQAKQIVKDDGSFDYDVLGTIIAEKETAAANAKEQEIAHNSTNPGGQSGDGGTNSMATDMAVASAKRAGTANESILANYRR